MMMVVAVVVVARLLFRLLFHLAPRLRHPRLPISEEGSGAWLVAAAVVVLVERGITDVDGQLRRPETRDPGLECDPDIQGLEEEEVEVEVVGETPGEIIIRRHHHRHRRLDMLVPVVVGLVLAEKAVWAGYRGGRRECFRRGVGAVAVGLLVTTTILSNGARLSRDSPSGSDFYPLCVSNESVSHKSLPTGYVIDD